MRFWASLSMRAGMLVLVFLVVMQPAHAEVDDQPATSQASVAASALKGVELAAQEVAAQSTAAERTIEPSESEQKCLAEGIYFEARGESVRGQLAVGRVIMNRVESDAYPDNICGVVYQNDHMPNRCQFSFACDGKDDTITEHARWDEIQGYAAWLLANDARSGAASLMLASLSSSTHYHADYVSPDWAKRLPLTVRIGRHYFYSDPRA